ncbi:sulfotransferase [uncultured Gilvimarinus sp.]|uniref:sulfotransferase n=1 Tax=uncultured Gilvimarinus sp. TaxID=1689143 RepID=UPI0030EEFA2F|tara:strand:- start:5634 stop:6173 length:540 start_codon:yes stop_codon:yes gene_type:complete
MTPIFIVGSDRSGTSVTKRIIYELLGKRRIPFEPRLLADGNLVKSPVVSLLKECTDKDLRMQASWIMRQYNISEERGWHMYFERKDMLNTIWSYLDKLKHDKSVVHLKEMFEFFHRKIACEHGEEFIYAIDDTPSNVLIIDLLVAMFPRCKVVHCIRDGREVAASVISRQWWGGAIDRH